MEIMFGLLTDYSTTTHNYKSLLVVLCSLNYAQLHPSIRGVCVVHVVVHKKTEKLGKKLG
jgi:hypothetical protein